MRALRAALLLANVFAQSPTSSPTLIEAGIEGLAMDTMTPTFPPTSDQEPVATTMAPTPMAEVVEGSFVPTMTPTFQPTMAQEPPMAKVVEGSFVPTMTPTFQPTTDPMDVEETPYPTPRPTDEVVGSRVPTMTPTFLPTSADDGSMVPTRTPTFPPSPMDGDPTPHPTVTPTIRVSFAPTIRPTAPPTASRGCAFIFDRRTCKSNESCEWQSQSGTCASVEAPSDSCEDISTKRECNKQDACEWNLKDKSCYSAANCSMITKRADCIGDCAWHKVTKTCSAFEAPTLPECGRAASKVKLSRAKSPTWNGFVEGDSCDCRELCHAKTPLSKWMYTLKNGECTCYEFKTEIKNVKLITKENRMDKAKYVLSNEFTV